MYAKIATINMTPDAMSNRYLSSLSCFMFTILIDTYVDYFKIIVI